MDSLKGRVNDLLQSENYGRLGEHIGAGTFADVYALKHPGLVAKITQDSRDAYVAELARRHGGCRNLARIERVWSLPRLGAFAIVVERLQPLPPALRAVVPDYLGDLGTGEYELQKVVRKWSNGQARIPRWSSINVWKAAASNLRGIADDLDSIGCTSFRDWHHGNVMLRPGDRVVLSDFGCTTSPEPSIPEVA